MTVDFSDEKERPFYIGLAQTLTAPATIIAPLIGGWIADKYGLERIVIISIAMVLLGLIFLTAGYIEVGAAIGFAFYSILSTRANSRESEA